MLLNLFVALFPLAVYLFDPGRDQSPRPACRHAWGQGYPRPALRSFRLPPFTIPSLLNYLYFGELNSLSLEDSGEEVFEAIWQRWFLIWIAYYAGLACLVPFLLLLRRNVRGIYNVDLAEFRNALFQTLEDSNLVGRHQGEHRLPFPFLP